ncbi:MAG: DMT family transporter [Negativicutes bacterium]|jgi:drug/metabolite transporter (DMT)-like permease
MRANILLLIAATIWGTAFVAQSISMQYIGPFLFGGVRFALGSFVLIIPAFLLKRRVRHASVKTTLTAGAVVGGVLFVAASFQQTGIQYTTIGKAGFITCLYIVIVPLIGIFLKHKAGKSVWLGCAVAVVGLYLLSIKGDFTISYGDFLMLLGAFVWSAHILVIDHYVKQVDAIQLSCLQFAVCATFSMIAALFFEPITLIGLDGALPSILFAGIVSVGFAYTLQVIAQKDAKPAHAAIILSLETVFAALSGWLILGEHLTEREIIGCALMLAGMLISQLGPLVRSGRRKFGR